MYLTPHLPTPALEGGIHGKIWPVTSSHTSKEKEGSGEIFAPPPQEATPLHSGAPHSGRYSPHGTPMKIGGNP